MKYFITFLLRENIFYLQSLEGSILVRGSGGGFVSGYISFIFLIFESVSRCTSILVKRVEVDLDPEVGFELF